VLALFRLPRPAVSSSILKPPISSRLAAFLLSRLSIESEHTSWHSVHLVLDKEVYEGDDAAVKGARDVFPVLDRSGVGRAEGDAAESPGYGGQQVGDHEDVVPVMVVGGGDIGPAAAGEGSEDAPEGDEGGQLVARPAREQVPEGDEGESRTCRNKSVFGVSRVF